MSRLVADGDRSIDLGELSDGHRAAVGQHVQRRELGEPEAQLAELAGEPDHELAPQRAAHRHALADLADVRDPAPGRERPAPRGPPRSGGRSCARARDG